MHTDTYMLVNMPHKIRFKGIYEIFPFLSMLPLAEIFSLKFHQGPEESEESESNSLTEQAVSKSSEVGRVMTEEEYEEWKKEKEGGRQSEEDTGIDWGMGEGQYPVFEKNKDHIILSGQSQDVSLFSS